jgi:hypothetical protein
MQWVLGRLRGRVGVAVVLFLVVLGAVGIGRLIGDSSGPDGSGFSNGESRPPSINTSAGNDGVAEENPSIPTGTPSLSPGAAAPLKVAGKFMAAWLDSGLSAEKWHDGVSRYATTGLSTKLTGVDPAGVPAERLTGDLTLSPRGEGAAAVIAPVDSGTVELRMLVVDGKWLVDGVTWNRA